MPDEIRPALTRDDLTLLRSVAHFIENQKDGRLSTVWPEGANPWRELGPRLRDLADRIEALLAMFTQADVDRLGDWFEPPDGEGGIPADVKELAARIAALLPPRDPQP